MSSTDIKERSGLRIVIITVVVLLAVTAGITVYVLVFEKDSLISVLKQDDVLMDEVKGEVLAQAEELKHKVDDGEITEDEMKRQIQQALAQALQELVQKKTITQGKMDEQMQMYFEAVGGFNNPSSQDLASFCEQMNSGPGFDSGGRPAGLMGLPDNVNRMPLSGNINFEQNNVNFEQMQALMSEMQSLCADDVYTSVEEARFQELQSQMPQHGFR